MESVMDHKVWFITGCSSGLGLEIVREALRRNDKVIATARSLDSIRDLESASCKIMQFDVTEDPSILQRKAATALQLWNRVDILVNNAGSGTIGFQEEIPPDAYARLFQVNFFGQLNVTNAFLPHMRQRKDGVIVFVGSRSSYRTEVPMMGAYVASKAATAAVVDGLAAELNPFNIKVLHVLPGAMRTRAWHSVHDVQATPETIEESADTSKVVKRTFADYDTMRKKCMDTVTALKKKADEAADPAKAASVIVDVVRCEGVGIKAKERGGWPFMLALGEDAERDIRAKCEKVLKNLDEWKEISHQISQ